MRGQMKPSLRLVAYVRPYSLQAAAAVLMMATVGLLDAFRVLLIKPIFDQVLKPSDTVRHLQLIPEYTVRGFHFHLSLEQLVPHYFHNAWTMVAFALVASTLIKSLCDYAGTYLSYKSLRRSVIIPNPA